MYYSGDTSAEQNEELRRYFTEATDIPADLEPERCLFQASATDRIPIPDGLEERLSTGIDRHIARERISRRRKLFFRTSAAAAVLACLLAIGPNLLKDTGAEPVAAPAPSLTSANIAATHTAETVEPEAISAAGTPESVPVKRRLRPLKKRHRAQTMTEEEGVMMAIEALATIRQKIESGSEAIESMELCLNEYSNTINEILE